MVIESLRESDTMPDAEVGALEGTFLDERHFDCLVSDYRRVNKPNGDPLLVYVPDVLPDTMWRAAFSALKPLRLSSKNRIAASGGRRVAPTRRDGVTSGTVEGRIVPSGVVGYLDRSAREPWCRQSALMRKHLDAFQAVRPLLERMGIEFAQHLAGRHTAQRNHIEAVSPDFVIPGTPFTTVTVNRSWRTAAHRDEATWLPGSAC